MDSTTERHTCPFCSFSIPTASEDEVYFLVQHVELCHPENGVSPFIALDDGGPRDDCGSDEGSPSSLTKGAYEKREREEEEEGEEGEGGDEGKGERQRRRLADREDDDVDDDDDEEEIYVECPLQCGEVVTIAELSSHTELHYAEDTALDGTGGGGGGDRDGRVGDGTLAYEHVYHRAREEDEYVPAPKHTRSLSNLVDLGRNAAAAAAAAAAKRDSHRKNNGLFGLRELRDRWLRLRLRNSQQQPNAQTNGFAVRRLGKSELGPHAYEEKMPGWLMKQLEIGAKVTVTNQLNLRGQITPVETVENEVDGVVPVLAQLCEQDTALSKVFLCHPRVTHVFKMAREGGFCGYRNIQMMISFIRSTKSEGYAHFGGRIPSILELQDLIEAAWDMGINSSGRVETGGIKGTRKYIGTPEAQALLVSLGIGCEASAFNNGGQPLAYEPLLQAVMQYFAEGVTDLSQKVYRTSLPPIYFQHPGHSLTIVGLAIRRDGSMDLLVLDPMFKPSPGICRLIGTRFRSAATDKLLKAYCRGESYLKKYRTFEIMTIDARPPPGSGWSR